MDKQLQKAFEIANYMETLASQKQVLKEEYFQNIIFYHNGGVFHATENRISFVKTLVDLAKDTRAVLVDENNLPVEVENINEFLEKMLAVYYTTTNEYWTRYSQLRQSRTVGSLMIV
jgi:hypothetical protein